jgi:hypothetical protein
MCDEYKMFIQIFISLLLVYLFTCLPEFGQLHFHYFFLLLNHLICGRFAQLNALIQSDINVEIGQNKPYWSPVAVMKWSEANL